jgi:hypothetical protein
MNPAEDEAAQVPGFQKIFPLIPVVHNRVSKQNSDVAMAVPTIHKSVQLMEM